MAPWRREHCDDTWSMNLDTKPENAQSIREGVAVVCTHDAGMLVSERERDREGKTDHGCPSGGIKSESSTTIEP